MARTAALLVLTGLALALPALPVQAQSATPGIHNPEASTPVTLYMHLVDVQDFPINTQLPDDQWTQNTAYGLATSTTSCLPDGTPGVDASQAWHTFYGYSSPSYVEYLQQEGGKPRLHPERGISYDTHIDPATPFTLYWYLTVRAPLQGAEGGPNPDSVPQPVPNVVVQATMRTGDSISVDDKAYNRGEVIAQGKTPPATLLADQVLGTTGSPPAGVTALGPQGDGRWLYEFAIPMALGQELIPKATGYNLRVDVYMDNPACAAPDAALMPNTVSIHSSKEHRPRMELAITNPLRITALHPQFVGDDFVVHAAANAAWGNYDLAEPSPYTPQVQADWVQLTVDGPSPAPSLALANIVSATNPHYHHQDDVTLAYVWPYKVDHAQPGLYTVHLSVKNDQGTATATADSTFELGRNLATECTATEGCTPVAPVEHERHGAPALGLAPLAAGLAVVAMALRRRTA